METNLNIEHSTAAPTAETSVSFPFFSRRSVSRPSVPYALRFGSELMGTGH